MSKTKYRGKHRQNKKQEQQKQELTVKSVEKVKISIKPTKKAKPAKPKQRDKSYFSKLTELIKFDIRKFKSKLAVYIYLGLFIALLVITGIYGFRAYNQVQIENYKSAVYQIRVNTEESIINTNNLFVNFEDTLVTEEAATDFKDAADNSRRALLATQTLNPPERFKASHKRMLSLYKKSYATYSSLTRAYGYVGSRNKITTKMGADLNAYHDRIEKSFLRSETTEFGAKASSSIHKTVNGLKKIDSQSLQFQDKSVAGFVHYYDAKAKELDLALLQGNRWQIKKILKDASEEHTKWERAFVNFDNKLLAKYQPQIKEINSLYKEISD